MVNRLRTRGEKEITTRDLLDQSQIESGLKSTLRSGQVLAENSGMAKVFGSLEEAWDEDVSQVEDKAGVNKESRTFDKDLRRAKSMGPGNPGTPCVQRREW